MQLIQDKKRLRLIILLSLLFMFSAHAFCYANLSFSGASVMVDAAKGNSTLISDGQFLVTLYLRIRGSLSAPFVVGLLTALYITAAAVLIADLLRISHPLSLFALCGTLALHISVTAVNASMLHIADAYFLAFLFSVLGVWLCFRHPLGFIAGTVCFAAVPGLEPAMYAAGPALALTACLVRTAKGEDVRFLIISLFKALLGFAAGFALYVLAALVFCRRQGLELNAAFHFPYGSGVMEAYLFPIRQLFEPTTAYAALCAFLFGVLLALSLIAILIRLPMLGAPAKPLMLASAALLPLVICLPVFGSKAEPAVSQRFACCILPVSMAALLELFCGALSARSGMILRRAIACAFGVTFLSSIVFANQVYLKKNLEYQTTLSVMTRVIEMAEQTEGFDPSSTPVAIVGSIEDSALSIPHKGFEHLSVLDAAANNFTASSQEENIWYFWEIMGYPFNFISDYERDLLAQTPDVQAMPAFPDRDCCRMVEGTLVIRLSE